MSRSQPGRSRSSGPEPQRASSDGDSVVIAPSTLMPMVSVIVPTYQEEPYLRRCVESLLATPYPRDRFELLIVDGGSSDRTVEIAEALALERGNIRVLHNPKRRQAAALNLGFSRSSPDSAIIIRADAHATYSPDFIGRCVAALERSGADMVVFAALAAADARCFQVAVAAAQNTPLGVGDSWYRVGRRSRFVDHGFHGCFRRSILEKSGVYDETFSHNEDAELSFRIAQAGGRIYLERSLEVAYYPRPTLRALALQYFRYGRGRAQNILKHRTPPVLRQALPMLLVLGEAAIAVALAVGIDRRLAAVLVALVGAYAAIMLTAGGWFALRRGRACLLFLPAVLATMHHAWGAGALAHFMAAGWRGLAAASRWRDGTVTSVRSKVPSDSGVAPK
jgi:succinoglycan biosynthesis protein ExoA